MHANIAKKFLARKTQNSGVELNFYEHHTSPMKDANENAIALKAM